MLNWTNNEVGCDFFENITVIVGEDLSKFLVHKKIACATSDFFLAACNGDWKQSHEETIRLPEVDPDTFGVYFGWLYTASIDVGGEEIVRSCPKYKGKMSNTEQAAVHAQLVDAYSLGAMLQDAKFRNAVVDEVIKFTDAQQTLPGIGGIGDLWEKLQHGAKLAKLLVDYFAVDYKSKTFVANAEKFPPGLILEIAKSCVVEAEMLASSRRPRNRPKCFYHDHNDERDKCA